MNVLRMNRVELLLPGKDIPEAVRVFNEVLGAHFEQPKEVPGEGVLATIDYAAGIELFGPIGDTSELQAVFDRKPRRGAIGPLVWEVEDLDAAKAEAMDKGYGVSYEFGAPGARQVHLDADQLFGFSVTFTERRGANATPRPTRATRFQRVELIVGTDDIEPARQAFADLLGGDFSPLRHIEDPGILTTTDDRIGIELLAPASTDSPAHAPLSAKGRGRIGPLVWWVDDLDVAKAGVVDVGYRVHYEYGAPGARQVHFDAEQLFGYGITFTERPAGQHL